MPSGTRLGLNMIMTTLLAGAAVAVAPAFAQDIGAASAVNPLSESTPPNGGTRVLRIRPNRT